MEFNTLVTRHIGGLGDGAGGVRGVRRDGENDVPVCQLSMLPMRLTSALEYTVRGRGRLLPPPFLTKIYEMVDDPNTNSIISWGSNNTSFIVLDQIEFAAEILPKYFKHSNFSSFVYQLNNYGFKKISWDKLEYENPWFQAGKKHWLQNITRRNQRSEHGIMLQQTSLAPSDDSAKVRMETELETLKTVQNSMKVEIQKIRQQQEEMENRFKSFKESITSTDHEEMVIPLLALKFVHHLKKKREIDSQQSSKKQKLVPYGNTGIAKDGTDKKEMFKQSADGKDEVQEELNEMQPDREIISSPDDSQSSNKKQKDDSVENCAFWKKILEDDSEHKNGEQAEFSEHYPKIIIALEDLIAANGPNEGENSVPKALHNKLEEEDQLSY